MPDPPHPTAWSAGTRRIGSFLGADTADEIVAAQAPTPEGGWSSYPPRECGEMNEAQSELEEIRYLRVDGESGFGSFSCCSTDGEIDDTPRVSDCDVYRVPWGFHGPAAADPRHVMCHLDVLAGPISGTGMASLRGTLHAWVRDALEPLPTDPRLPTTGARPARSPWRDEGAVRLLPHPIERRSAEAT